jgi:hypothetical protein
MDAELLAELKLLRKAVTLLCFITASAAELNHIVSMDEIKEEIECI